MFLSFVGLFVRSESPFLRPDPQQRQAVARRSCPRLAVAPTFRHASALARPYLDSFEHDGTLGTIGMTIGGEPACGRDQSRHNLVFGGSKDPNHDAAMRIGSEAPGRRTHSTFRHDSHESPRDPATSNRHRRPVTSGRTGPKLSGALQRPPFIAPGAERRRPAPRPPAPAATGRSEACAPRPRSWSCECHGRSRCGLETTAPRRCPSGT